MDAGCSRRVFSATPATPRPEKFPKSAALARRHRNTGVCRSEVLSARDLPTGCPGPHAHSGFKLHSRIGGFALARKSRYGTIGQTSGGRAVHGLTPPFDPAEGGVLNWAELDAERAEQAEQGAVNAAASLTDPAEIAGALARAASAAEALGRWRAAASYRDAAEILTIRGRFGIAEVRGSLGWDARGCALPDPERSRPTTSTANTAEPSI